MRLLFVYVLLFVTAALSAQQKTIHFINGQWFNGNGFTAGEFYSVNGYLTKSKPTVVDTVIDLKNQYVIPPYGEAHNHSPETDQDLDVYIERYLADGIFYIKNPNSIPFATNKIKHRLNKPNSVDVLFANGGITANGGHPVTLYNYLLTTTYKKALPGWTGKSFEGEAYYLINNKEELEKKWPFILAQKPGFIKFYLIFSEEYKERKDDTAFNGKKGIDPALAKIIVQKAHAAGLLVSAHAETPHDLEVALKAGVDEINHLPGYQVRWRGGYTADYYKIDKKLVRLLKKKRVHVDPTYSLLKTELKPMSSEQYQAQVNVQIHNLQLLRKYKVPVTIGCDSYNLTAKIEMEYLHALKVYSDLELLKMWCELTPAAVFPQRKIAKLQEGYEASFLLLKTDPTADFSQLFNIQLRVKQGVLLW
ncbi:imidazolonepropionase-like amidohydrolase [Lacibacter cauensis]|uniref:Imidazolonepropionase-like amidohydrolase n=1 Tax=Lacibacter cauensis TaxID=510947 RepID=A0A562SQX9_9BACT|nr:amidohydrolase family protein [Lacibacter cauensis]TWI83216.1 imidazolonepropionase-like amidohydrolase [Lacibacter cauensis]